MMTSKKELETMVNQFKVTDLQSLLNFAGQNSRGRKTELQKKVLSLIRHNISIPLEMKIRTMYRQMLIETQQQNDYNYFRSDYDSYGSYYNPVNSYATQSTAGMSYDSYSMKNNYYQNHNSSNSYYEDCMRKNNHLYNLVNCAPSQHYDTSSSSVLFDYMSFLEPGTYVPELRSLKDGQFKKLSFYRYQDTVVPLMPMKAQHKCSDVFDYTHSFTVSEEAYNFLSWSKKNEKENRFQLQLRICVLDQTTLNNLSEISDSLPLALSVKVNEKNCQLPPAIPSTNKQGMLLKRMNAPVNITLQSSKKNQLNTLAINWSIECKKLYGFTVHIVEKYTSDELIDVLKKTKQRSSEITKKRISDQLNDDDDIAATSFKVSLICPLGKVLMSLPVRATTCNHIQCFDGSLYIKMNEVKSVWQCPVCNSNCFYEDLFVDGYFVDILNDAQLSSNVSEVHINNDGSWEPVIVKKRKHSETESGNRKKKCISDLSDQESDKHGDNESIVGSSNQKNHVEDVLKNDDVSCSILNKYSTSSSCLNYNAINNCSENSNESSNTTINGNHSKTNVILVDLTSDSELEESNLPLNLKKSEVNDLDDQTDLFKVVPPIYDINDDSDELS